MIFRSGALIALAVSGTEFLLGAGVLRITPVAIYYNNETNEFSAGMKTILGLR